MGRRGLILVVGLVLLAGGCGKGAGSVVRANRLKAIGIAYHNYVNDKNKAPAKVEELVTYLSDVPDVAALLTNGEVVFYYGVGITEMTTKAGSANTILAYYKDVPEKGGWVLMGDASVMQVTADEFQQKPKAGK